MSLPPPPPAPTTSSGNTNTRPWSQSALTHTKADWEAVHPVLERLYVRERRKLHEIMQYMETKHAFKATTQMYKKRFAKWGFQKNKKRWATADPALSILNLSCGETDVKFMFLSSVKTWSNAFYETPGHHRKILPAGPTIEANEVNFAFKMITELLDSGYGELAGRLARKAFLLIEGLLTVDGPALVWNLLDLMHNMVIWHLSGTDAARQQQTTTQLFHMLLVHLDGLVGTRLGVPETHPLSTILRLLKRLAAENKTQQDGATHYPINPQTATVLEQAWGLNAQLIFDHFDPSLLHVYWYLGWDSCSIKLPPHVVNVLLDRLRQLGLDFNKQSSSPSFLTSPDTAKVLVTPAVKRYLNSEAKWDSMNPPHTQHFLPLVPACTGGLANHNEPGTLVSQLTTNILRGLKEYGQTVPLGISAAIDPFGKPLKVCEMLRSTTDQTALLGTFAGLLATKVLAGVELGQQSVEDTWDRHLGRLYESIHPEDAGNNESDRPQRGIPRTHVNRIQNKIQAMTTAWAIRISMKRDADLAGKSKGSAISTQKDKPDDGPPKQGNAERIQHLRKLVALQEQARGKVNLQVVREMWALEDELKTMGEDDQAKETNREWRRRLNAYLGDIPVQQA